VDHCGIPFRLETPQQAAELTHPQPHAPCALSAAQDAVVHLMQHYQSIPISRAHL
jgi:hypothetical protein